MARIKNKPVKTKFAYDRAALTVKCLGGRVYLFQLTTASGEEVEMVWESKSYRRAWTAAYGLSAAFRMGGYKALNRWIKDGIIEYD